MILDARTLTDLESCPRRIALSRDWKVARWRPKSLLDACLRSGVFQLSSGSDVESVIAALQAQLMREAAQPGMELEGESPYTLAKDLCAMLATILHSVAMLTLLVVKEVPPVKLPACEWRPSSWTDESGSLHRWITVDRLSDSVLSRELHSWWTMGDLATLRAPLTLHIVQIGARRKGRYESAWTRMWQHPSMPHLQKRFRRKDGSALRGWIPVHFSDDSDSRAWAEQMATEGVTADLIRHVNVLVPSDAACHAILQDIEDQSTALRESEDLPYDALPMHRSSCDGIVPCPWQAVCYGDQSVNIEDLGLYLPRK